MEMARENKIRYVILGLLSHEPLTGYDIKKRIEGSISYFYDASFGQIYPELASMEEQMLISKKIEMYEKKPLRKIYSITESGLSELQKWLTLPIEEEKVRYDILLKIFFGRCISAEENVRNIREFRLRNAEKLTALDHFEENLRTVLGENVDHIYYYLTVRFGQQVMQAHIKWADEAVAFLENMIRENVSGD
jgi:DNA-binding PadR family transcriptional regulator